MRKQTRTRRHDSGITLIELMVVMVIIAMFAAIVGQRLFRNVDKAKQTAAKTQIQELETVLDLYRLDVGQYPTTEQGLRALQEKPTDAENWDGPYLKKDIPPDQWGNPFVYRRPGQHGDFDLLYGGDGQEGGEGADADIVNWQ